MIVNLFKSFGQFRTYTTNRLNLTLNYMKTIADAKDYTLPQLINPHTFTVVCSKGISPAKLFKHHKVSLKILPYHEAVDKFLNSLYISCPDYVQRIYNEACRGLISHDKLETFDHVFDPSYILGHFRLRSYLEYNGYTPILYVILTNKLHVISKAGSMKYCAGINKSNYVCHDNLYRIFRNDADMCEKGIGRSYKILKSADIASDMGFERV